MPKPHSQLDTFLTRLLDEVFLPRATEIAETATQWFDRMLIEAERRATGQLPPPKPPKKRKERARKGQKAGPPSTVPKRTVGTAYDVLGVNPKAPQEVLQAAYKALARMYHPDVVGRDSIKVSAKMQMVNAAWECIKDPGRRAKYDKEIGL